MSRDAVVVAGLSLGAGLGCAARLIPTLDADVGPFEVDLRLTSRSDADT